MQFFKAATAAAALCLGILAAPAAKADVIYTFTQVGPASGAPGARLVNISGQVVVTDAAAANGFAVSLSNISSSPYQASLAGLISLEVENTNQENRIVGFEDRTLDDFTRQSPFAPPGTFQSVFNLTGGAGDGLNGQLNYFVPGVQFRLTFSGSSFTGNFGADGGGGCGGSTLCTYSGTITTTIPEPASMALFGAGLLGLAAVRRKRAALTSPKS
jgi:hypothetical protein